MRTDHRRPDTYVIAGAITVQLVTDRAALTDLDVPLDVPAVVVIEGGRCKHVLPISLVQEIAATFEAEAILAAQQLSLGDIARASNTQTPVDIKLKS